jgi:hypothetical protein
MSLIDTQTLIEDLWVPLLLGAGGFVMGAILFKSLDPTQKLTRKDYRILLLFGAFMAWFIYVVVFHKYASRLWDSSVVGFVTVVLVLSGLLALLILCAVRTPTAQSRSASVLAPGVRTVPQPSPRLLRWQILVIVWAVVCILGSIVAVFTK